MTYQSPNMSVLGDATRLAILQTLASHPLPVNELAAGFPMSRPAISQHLRVLNEAGLVTAKKYGTQRIYEVNSEGLLALKAYFDQFWDSILINFKAAAEAAAQPQSQERRHVTKKSSKHGT